MSGPVITLLSDYGLDDEFVGVCHGVIATICPDARVIDIGHGVPRHDVRAGALMLRGALPFMPLGVHVSIVDPDVGSERRAVALRLADERILVGPDNGVLMPTAERLGGILDAVEIARSRFRLEPVSATFHGRDIFAPVAAHLAAGVPVAEVGEPCDARDLIRLELPRPRREGGTLVAHAASIDRFGNVQTDVTHEDLVGSGLKLGRAVSLVLGGASTVRDDRGLGDADALGTGVHEARYVRMFADVRVGELLIYEDAHRVLAVAVNHGSAAELLGLAVDHELRISPA